MYQKQNYFLWECQHFDKQFISTRFDDFLKSFHFVVSILIAKIPQVGILSIWIDSVNSFTNEVIPGLCEKIATVLYKVRHKNNL